MGLREFEFEITSLRLQISSQSVVNGRDLERTQSLSTCFNNQFTYEMSQIIQTVMV